MSVSSPPVSDTPTFAAIKVVRNRQFAYLAVIAAAFAAALTVWHCWNHALPAPDDSSYILASFKYCDLLHHPKLWRPTWWHEMLTVNQAYPPAAMIFNGMLRLCCGFGNWVNILSVALFSILLTAATCGITTLLTGDKRAGLIAALLVNLYPETSCVSHLFALDLPLLSMIACGLCAIFWWRVHPSLARAIACGLIVGMTCLTKQIAAAYLVGPGVFCFIEAVAHDLKKRRAHSSLQLVLVAVLAAAIMLPWWLTNLEFIHNWANDNQVSMGHLSLYQVFPQRVWWYLCSLPSIMSPLLLAAFLGALAVVGKPGHRALFPLTLSSLVGVGMISTLTWAFPSLRYDAPLLIGTAGYTGILLSGLWHRRAMHGVALAGGRAAAPPAGWPVAPDQAGGRAAASPAGWPVAPDQAGANRAPSTGGDNGAQGRQAPGLFQPAVAALMALALSQYISFNFCPYPLAQPAWLARISEALGVQAVETFGLSARDRRSSLVVHSTPAPEEDWGQEWCIKTIDSLQGRVPVFLNILPQTGTLNGNTFELMARTLGSLVRPTTSRRWTVVGDEVAFDAKQAMNYQWYLLKSGEQGGLFKNDQSRWSYNKLIDFVQHSGSFICVGSRKAADGCNLYLYAQTDIVKAAKPNRLQLEPPQGAVK